MQETRLSDPAHHSTGFTSVYVMAHEIGHNLGMSHDSSGNSCPSNGYIMSPRWGKGGDGVMMMMMMMMMGDDGSATYLFIRLESLAWSQQGF